ncbi:MAG: methyltransferase domain-containing protein [Anaerolineae bacterium]|nr:methyltransferase domain-containing protein [Anaerolineae bacterium]
MKLSTTNLDALTRKFAAIVACPACHGSLTLRTDRLTCNGCWRIYSQIDSIWRFLLPEQTAQYQPFLDAYQRIRQGGGWDRQDDDYYLKLPIVARDDPLAHIWRIRARTFGRLRAMLDQWGTTDRGWALDLGAGNCWLSCHLARLGYRVLALDLNVEGRDGLRGGQVYWDKGGVTFVRGQSSMDCLPVQDRSISLCVISAALHYAKPDQVLASVYRALTPDGRLVVMDSPVYQSAASGDQMMQEQRARFKAQCGIDELQTTGKGYLVLDTTIAAFEQTGFRVDVQWIERFGSRYVHRLIRQANRKREEARFPLFIGTK